MEWAIWQVLLGQNNTGSEPPKVFNTRIKRLLDLDRSQTGSTSPRFAFSDTVPRGKGADIPFTEFDTFCVALGIDLLDAGFKQAEVVFFLKHIRPQLRKAFDHLAPYLSVSLRNLVPAENYPKLPSYQSESGDLADFRIFVLIEKVELKEAYSSISNTDEPLILQPIFCHGITALQQEINVRDWEFRKAMILELSHTARLITKYLKEAPIARRGRS
ncbi:MAG: hypothetical protein ABW082_02085 [Sedimenticola sp.]